MDKNIFLESTGTCPTCDQNVTFRSVASWLRDHFLCPICGSIPRERALMQVIEMLYPNWRKLTIHESSPVNRGASAKLKRECKTYLPSQYFPDQVPGSTFRGFRCENFESLTFSNNSIDLHVSQDVLEHIFDPEKAFQEIARTLKPGGAHIFSVPIVNRNNPSKTRAVMNDNGEIQHIEPPMYHGNPINNEGSLVTVDWGFDICQRIFSSCGLFTFLFYIDDLSKGIRAEFIEIFATVKSPAFYIPGHN